jgi:Cu+-exporting ATPase
MTETIQMKVSGLMCSFCTMSLETALKRYDGVRSVLVNLVHGLVLVEADTKAISREELATAVRRLGYDVSATEKQQYATDEALFSLIKRRGAIGMILAAVDLFVDPLNVFGLSSAMRSSFSLVVAAFVLLWVGYPILRKTILAIRQRVINANVLLSTGAWGSFAVGALSLVDPRWPNFLPVASWLMALHLFFGYFKLDTRKKAAEAVRKLLSLQPARARVERSGETLDVLSSEVVAGEITMVRPGERIPLDGDVIDGTASVDQSSFTGESVPVTRTAGDSVIGGTLNLDGALRIRVTHVGEETFVSRIVGLMMRIAERKPPIELLADRLMNYYGPVVFIVAGLAFAGWLFATGNAIASTLVLLTTIIMGYPCALGITTPMLAAIAGGKGISIGLLVKASEVFYELSRVNTVVLDKTGTLTYGRPTVTDVVDQGLTRAELMSLAASVERSSEHPLAKSIVRAAELEETHIRQATDFRAFAGKGVRAVIDGEIIYAGKPSFLAEQGVNTGRFLQGEVERLSAEGKTVVMLAKNGATVGVFGLQDTPRRGASRLIAKLKERGARTVMLTGDSRSVAEAIGKQLGIDRVEPELLPEEKVVMIERLQREGARVAMVGDGINDAPALAQANAGIALGAGTDVAIESAGVILIGDHIEDVAGALDLGKAAYRTMTGNVVVAVLFNIVGMILAAFGMITPMFAIAFMILSIFAILLNTLRVRWITLERSESVETAYTVEREFRIPNMVCDACGVKMREVLAKVPGIHDVTPNAALKQIAVRYEPVRVQPGCIQSTLEEIGFMSVEI